MLDFIIIKIIQTCGRTLGQKKKKCKEENKIHQYCHLPRTPTVYILVYFLSASAPPHNSRKIYTCVYVKCIGFLLGYGFFLTPLKLYIALYLLYLCSMNCLHIIKNSFRTLFWRTDHHSIPEVTVTHVPIPQVGTIRLLPRAAACTASQAMHLEWCTSSQLLPT